MKVNRENEQKIKNIIHEQLQQIVGEFLCLTKNFDTNGDDYILRVDRVELKIDSNIKWVFYKLNNQWVQLNGTTKEREGKWSCDGSDNFFIIAGNKRYSSKSDWETINPVFNCLLFGHSDRNMEHSFSENEFKVPYKSRGAHYVFYKDYKWSNIQTQTGTVLNSGTWKCDGDDEFEIISPKATFSSKKGWTKL
jgi:hypothetical protein